MTYILKRSKRKTISLTITTDAELIVRAPRLAPKFYIDHIVRQKQEWIKKHLATIQSKKPRAQKLVDGSIIWLFGNPYKLLLNQKSQDLTTTAIKLPSALDLKKNLANFYKTNLQDYLSTKVPELAEKMNLCYQQIKVTSAKKRLGSCNTRQNLCFSYRCAVMPTWVIDYIIVHELAHLRQMNHSTRFWKIVENHFPEYKQAKKWIKENQARISAV